MCVYITSEIKTLKEDTYYYKLIQKAPNPNLNIYSSMTIPIDRSPQYKDPTKEYWNNKDTGTTFYYEIGKEITSDFYTTPGMYCFVNSEIAKERNYWRDLRVVKVLVKKGTKIRYAKSFSYEKENNVVLVETLTPIEILA